LVLQAAALGRGVALGRLAYAMDDLAAHRLRVPFGPVLRMDLRYHLLVPEGRATEPAITAFGGWLAGEAEGFRRAFEQQVTDLENNTRPLHSGAAAKGKRK